MTILFILLYQSVRPSASKFFAMRLFVRTVFPPLAFTTSDLSETDAESDIGDSFSSTSTGMEVPTDNEGILVLSLKFEPGYERDQKVPICKNLVLIAYASFDKKFIIGGLALYQ